MGRRDVIDFKGQCWAILSDLFTALRDVYHQEVHDRQKNTNSTCYVKYNNSWGLIIVILYYIFIILN